MAKYLIEISHEPEHYGCDRTVADFIETGAAEFTAADWGCHDNEHKAWLVVDAQNRDVVKKLIPLRYRPQSTIVQLSKFMTEDKAGFLLHHSVKR
jgi:hypothetical protein